MGRSVGTILWCFCEWLNARRARIPYTRSPPEEGRRLAEDIRVRIEARLARRAKLVAVLDDMTLRELVYTAVWAWVEFRARAHGRHELTPEEAGTLVQQVMRAARERPGDL